MRDGGGYHPGPIASWDLFPAVWPGVTGPLMYNPPASIQTPDIQRMGVGPVVTFRRWGLPVGYMPPETIGVPVRQWAKGKQQPWGVGDQTAVLDDYDQHMAPNNASERVRPVEAMRCVAVDESAITPTGVTFELVRINNIPSASVCIIERAPTIWESADALDGDGDVVFTYGDLNGMQPCKSQLIHPDPAVDPLTWEFAITISRTAYAGQSAEPYVGPTTPAGIVGEPLLETWDDLRYGDRSRWGDRLQFLAPARSHVRYWVTLFGPADRYKVTIGARLGGYWQLGGRKGAALDSVLQRIV